MLSQPITHNINFQLFERKTCSDYISTQPIHKHVWRLYVNKYLLNYYSEACCIWSLFLRPLLILKQWYVTISTRVNCVTKYTHLNMRVESHNSVCYIFAFHSLANFRILQRQIGIPTAAMTILALVLWGLNLMTSFFADGIWYHLIKKIDEKWHLYITVPDLRLHGQWNYPEHICKIAPSVSAINITNY